MNRGQREMQLRRLLATPKGWEILIAAYINAVGLFPQVGMLLSQMIEAILDREFADGE